MLTPSSIAPRKSWRLSSRLSIVVGLVPARIARQRDDIRRLAPPGGREGSPDIDAASAMLHNSASPIRQSQAPAVRNPSRLPLVIAWITGGLLLFTAFDAMAQRTRKLSPPGNATTQATGALKVITGQAGSVVFINNVRHGMTGDKGELDLPRVHAGSSSVRVRSVGFTDWTGPVVIAAGASRTVKVTQSPTTDEATLHYQKGDALRDQGKNKDAVEEYRQALALRPNFLDARIAMARSLTALQDFQEAEKQIQSAIKAGGRTLAEAQTVLANLRRHQGLIEESIVEYRKAIRLARGNSFEAHIGLAIALNEMSDPRLIDEISREYRTGILQDMETEPILYYQLGEILEKAGRKKEAIAAYRNYLRLDPEGEYASAAESVIEQLKNENNNQQ